MTKKGAVTLLAAVLLLHGAVYFVIRRNNPESILSKDSRGYLACKDAYVSTGSMDSEECLKSPFGYPYALAVLGVSQSRPEPGIFFNHVAVALTAVLLYLLLGQFLSARAAWLWAFLFAADFTLLRNSNKLLTESLFLCLFYLSIAVMAGAFKSRFRNGLLGLCGVLQAAAIFTRPIAAFWPWLQALYLLIALPRPKEKKFWPAHVLLPVFFYLFYAVGIPAYWAHRNETLHGFKGLTTNAVNVVRLASVRVVQKGRGVGEAEANRWIDENIAVFRDEKYAQAKNIYRQVVLKYPVGFLRAQWSGLRKILVSGTAPDFAGAGRPGYEWALALKYPNLLWNTALLLLGIYFWLFGHRLPDAKRPEWARLAWVLGALLMGYFLVMQSPIGNARYRVPILPAVYFFAALGFNARRFGRRSS